MDLLDAVKSAGNAKVNVSTYVLDGFSMRKGFIISIGERDSGDYKVLMMSEPRYYDGNRAKIIGEKIAEDLQKLSSDLQAAYLL